MSVDKLVDSTQLDADLTSVANAIRTKGGTSASLAFPTDFVSAIAAIPSGGGGSTCAAGTFTPASNTNNYSINIGDDYDNFVLYRLDQENTSVRSLRVVICDFTETNYVRALISTNNSGGGAMMDVTHTTSGISKSNNVITYNKSNDYLVSGLLYRWVAW